MASVALHMPDHLKNNGSISVAYRMPRPP